MIAFCGGLFVVPLNAFIQHNTNEATRSRIVAGAGIIDSLFIIASAVISAILISIGFRHCKIINCYFCGAI
jgi:hypothetical protein